MKRVKKFSKKRAIKRAKIEAPNFSRAGPPRVTGTVPEMKYFDCSLIAFAIANSNAWASTMADSGAGGATLPVANMNCLFAPTVGAGLTQRVGRKVSVHKIKVRGFLQAAPQAAVSTGDASSYIRILLVQDNQTNAAQMTGAQLIGDTVNANTTVMSFQNPDQFGRFRVLKDKAIMFQDPNMTGSPTTADVVQGGMIRPFKITHKFKKLVEILFNAVGGGTIADIINTSFHVVANATSTAFAPLLTYACRTSFKDV